MECAYHPQTILPALSMEKMSSTKPVPSAKKLGTTVLEQFQKDNKFFFLIFIAYWSIIE